MRIFGFGDGGGEGQQAHKEDCEEGEAEERQGERA